MKFKKKKKLSACQLLSEIKLVYNKVQRGRGGREKKKKRKKNTKPQGQFLFKHLKLKDAYRTMFKCHIYYDIHNSHPQNKRLLFSHPHPLGNEFPIKTSVHEEYIDFLPSSRIHSGTQQKKT